MIFRDSTIPTNYMKPRTKKGTKELSKRLNEVVSLIHRFPKQDFIDPKELLDKLSYWLGDGDGNLLTTEWGYPIKGHDSTGKDGHKIILLDTSGHSVYLKDSHKVWPQGSL